MYDGVVRSRQCQKWRGVRKCWIASAGGWTISVASTYPKSAAVELKFGACMEICATSSAKVLALGSGTRWKYVSWAFTRCGNGAIARARNVCGACCTQRHTCSKLRFYCRWLWICCGDGNSSTFNRRSFLCPRNLQKLSPLQLLPSRLVVPTVPTGRKALPRKYCHLHGYDWHDSAECRNIAKGTMIYTDAARSFRNHTSPPGGFIDKLWRCHRNRSTFSLHVNVGTYTGINSEYCPRTRTFVLKAWREWSNFAWTWMLKRMLQSPESPRHDMSAFILAKSSQVKSVAQHHWWKYNEKYELWPKT